MSTGNSIQGSFGVSLTPLQRDFAQAEQMARTSATKVSAALNTVNKNFAGAGTFKQTQDRARAAAETFWQNYVDPATARRRLRNSARGFAPAPKGKYASPAEQEEEGMGGLSRRAFRAAGILTFVHTIASAFQQAVQEAAKLESTINKLTAPTGSAAFRSQGSIRSNLSGITDTLDELGERDAREFQGRERTPWMTLGHIVRRSRQFLTGDSDANEEAQKDRLRKRAVESISDMAEKQETLNRASAEGSERESALAKAQVEHRERLGDLAAIEAAAGVNNPAARNAENERARLEAAAIDDAADQRQRQLTLAAHAAELASQGLTTDQLRLAVLRDQIQAVDEQLSHTRLLTDEKRTQLQTQRAVLGNDLTSMQKEFYFDPKKRAQFQRDIKENERRDKEFNRTGGLLNPHFGINGEVIGGIDPITGEKRSNVPAFNWRNTFGPTARPDYSAAAREQVGERQAIEQPLTRDDMAKLLEKYWGPN